MSFDNKQISAGLEMMGLKHYLVVVGMVATVGDGGGRLI